MSENSSIEWTDHTFNPWIGCTKVSPGCAHCYAETLNKRTRSGRNWGKGAPRQRTTAAYWKQAIKWDRFADSFRECTRCGYRDHMAEGCMLCGCDTILVRPRVFPSLCDWLDDEVSIEWLADFLNLIRVTPNLDWLLLTKRPELWRKRMVQAVDSLHAPEIDEMMKDWLLAGNAPANVSLGVSVEDQERAEQRIPKLLDTPAALRFLSCEPLLGPLDLRKVNVTPFLAINALAPGALGPRTKIDWVIVGGESGPKARRCHVEWIRSVLGDCHATRTPCFVKQLGAVIAVGAGIPVRLRMDDRKGGNPAEWPEDLRVREMPALASV